MCPLKQQLLLFLFFKWLWIKRSATIYSFSYEVMSLVEFFQQVTCLMKLSYYSLLFIGHKVYRLEYSDLLLPEIVPVEYTCETTPCSYSPFLSFTLFFFLYIFSRAFYIVCSSNACFAAICKLFYPWFITTIL